MTDAGFRLVRGPGGPVVNCLVVAECVSVGSCETGVRMAMLEPGSQVTEVGKCRALLPALSPWGLSALAVVWLGG